jgi:hypothetical protein
MFSPTSVDGVLEITLAKTTAKEDSSSKPKRQRKSNSVVSELTDTSLTEVVRQCGRAIILFCPLFRDGREIQPNL